MVDILASCPLISIADSGADKTSRRHRVGGSLETVPGSSQEFTWTWAIYNGLPGAEGALQVRPCSQR